MTRVPASVPRTPPALDHAAIVAWARVSHAFGRRVLGCATVDQLAAALEELEQEAGRLAATGHAMAARRTAGHASRLARYIDRRRIEGRIA